MKLIFLVLLFTASNVLAQITQNELEQVFQATQKTYGEELRKQNIGSKIRRKLLLLKCLK